MDRNMLPKLDTADALLRGLSGGVSTPHHR
jgi:hypothetical protein